MGYLRILFRHFQSLQRRYRDSEDAKKRRPIRVDIIADPDALTILFLAVIGLLLFLNFILRFPSVVETIVEYNKF
jgi:hypothetical protein